jgi:vacuolar protein sorting-associated protein 13A/C
MKALGSVEVFTPGPSIAISMSCADLPIAGAVTDWMEGGWLDVPLGSSKKLPEPVKLIFPFKTESLVKYTSSRKLSRGLLEYAKGSEFFVLGMFLLAASNRHFFYH